MSILHNLIICFTGMMDLESKSFFLILTVNKVRKFKGRAQSDAHGLDHAGPRDLIYSQIWKEFRFLVQWSFPIIRLNFSTAYQALNIERPEYLSLAFFCLWSSLRMMYSTSSPHFNTRPFSSCTRFMRILK